MGKENVLLGQDQEDENQANQETPRVLLTPEQQAVLQQHLTPQEQQQQQQQQPQLDKIELNNNNNNNNMNNNNNTITDDNDNDEDYDIGKKKKKKDKKKDKKEKKKNKNQDDNSGDNIDSEDQENERVIIKSPILQKLKKKKGEGYEDEPYSTEMTHFDSGANLDSLDSPPVVGTPQIELDPEVFYDGGEKKKKGKKGKKNKDKFLTPEERRIKEESKDAKSFFSNERTFLSWIGLTFSLGAIGTSIITWFGSEGVSLATGLFLWGVSIIFMAYSTIQFRRRGHAIRTKTQGPFDDQKGPLSLVAMVVVGVSIYLVFFVVIRPTVNIGGDINQNNSTTKN
ncbi:hypothetical protein DICPUDRAFT_152640 [Dictyostelium purpureum]|uniref:DUF202 domain-containing protein n=1 Tax=Dictyostelium purpureum TaxID=5786 RepID=F0ZLX1_DICPU|nr:uncharacterized protein DICPUDRAFT_152640 [Dictyostelium purpureum]EGC35061.1 hypothetical protein DICPUDRAFT_152640 [Dictyostelium purpureum]|eukprot:XP_003288429.1 hypothetical protein DICPUDRAFT_152640 [Dictyostelium purpureum]